MWISFKEKMPPNLTYLLFYFKDGMTIAGFPVEAGYFIGEDIVVATQSIKLDSLCKSKTYWQNAPEPPKEEKIDIL